MIRLVFLLIALLCMSTTPTTTALSNTNTKTTTTSQRSQPSRRDVVVQTASATLLTTLSIAAPAYADFPSLLERVTAAQKQLSSVPKLIDEGKWDAVRAVLIEPPLSDCWAKTGRPLLSNYAEALGDAGGDELAALEAKEEAISHLRYLDMAVYNNVFNPIATEGTNGATKALIRSYYEDPINEYTASKAALDELVKLSKEL